MAVESIGGSLDSYGNFLVLDSPPGYIWNCNGCRSVTIQFANGAGQTWLSEAVQMEMPSLRMGLRKVTDASEIEMHRHEVGDDTWGAAPDAPERIAWPSVKKNLATK